MDYGPPDFSKIPMMPPPPGVIPNFVNAPSRGGSVLAAFSVCLILATIFVGLRLYVRLVLLRIFGMGDCLLLAGYAFAVVNSALAVDTLRFGFGRHSWHVPLSHASPILKSVWWQMKTYVVSLAFTKVAILCIYPHLSPSKPFQIWVWVLMGLVVSSSLVSLIWSICSCLPVYASWDLASLASGKCPINTSFIIYTGAMNVATDFAILILPMIMLRHVTFSRRKKLGIILILATGSLASLISVVRVIFSLRDVNALDGTWRNVPVVVWSLSELYAGVVCACLPTLRPLARYFPSRRGSFTEAPRRTNLMNRLDSKADTKSSFLDSATISNEGNRIRDDTREEYILNNRIIVITQDNVSAGGVQDVDAHGEKIEVV